MTDMTVTVWTKLGCGWCEEVVDLLHQRGIAFEERVVTGDRAAMEEMVRKSGQTLAPVVEIDGHLLVDTDADEVARYLDSLGESRVDSRGRASS
jgi:glutaredoxin 3